MNSHQAKRTAIRFVILLGCVSLFSDMTYESARSINGQYLQTLGRDARTIGWVAGIGELLGYGLRLISGYLADRTRRYWLVSAIGYILNLVSVPLLAWAGLWQLAVMLMIMERIGKAIRTPARDAMLSYGAGRMGLGWGFGFHEAMDQGGATIGPLLLTVILSYHHNSYPNAYQFLFIPAIIALCILFFASRQYPDPSKLALKADKHHVETLKYTRRFWFYLVTVGSLAAGYADFPLIAFHLKSKQLLTENAIPAYYALAMVAEALAALAFGKLYDRLGMWSLRIGVFLALCFSPLVFLGNHSCAIAGIIFWGIGMGVLESIIKAEVAVMVPMQKRGSAFGIYNTVFGIFWFAGSVLMGYLYSFSIPVLVIFALAAQGLSLVFLFVIRPIREPALSSDQT